MIDRVFPVDLLTRLSFGAALNCREAVSKCGRGWRGKRERNSESRPLHFPEFFEFRWAVHACTWVLHRTTKSRFVSTACAQLRMNFWVVFSHPKPWSPDCYATYPHPASPVMLACEFERMLIHRMSRYGHRKVGPPEISSQRKLPLRKTDPARCYRIYYPPTHVHGA